MRVTVQTLNTFDEFTFEIDLHSMTTISLVKAGVIIKIGDVTQGYGIRSDSDIHRFNLPIFLRITHKL
ncbi:MAG: hypothetical protein KZQ62_05535 [Candidatus Thiodiazotropha sp. (ex Lucinoma aequizonata)]|nr:hypothetical protein [Candidatus Thiodiazotropha sp. (ex Lucinoma aequizonata)]MCU7897956.1 hypothetical protein [Candidatus Thiodiazotropha sp. (ex Lucinoma aequizonata)]